MQTTTNILNTQGYFQRHFELCRTMSQQDAYDALEDEYAAITGKPKHKSYDAFRTAKSRYYNVRGNR
jgi:hypothetical protein